MIVKVVKQLGATKWAGLDHVDRRTARAIFCCCAWPSISQQFKFRNGTNWNSVVWGKNMVYVLDYEGTGGSAPLENDKMRLIAFQFCQMECFKKKNVRSVRKKDSKNLLHASDKFLVRGYFKMFQLHNFFVIQQEAIPVWTKCSIFFFVSVFTWHLLASRSSRASRTRVEWPFGIQNVGPLISWSMISKTLFKGHNLTFFIDWKRLRFVRVSYKTEIIFEYAVVVIKSTWSLSANKKLLHFLHFECNAWAVKVPEFSARGLGVSRRCDRRLENASF